nr:PilZ domain-containing protein [candidate division Zixibacteria bacterium]
MKAEEAVIAEKNFDYSEIVGREVKIRTEQFAERILTSRVVAVSGNNLVIDRSKSEGLIDSLIGNQKVVVHFEYKGEPVAFESILSMPQKGRMQIPVAARIYPEINRKYPRIPIDQNVRLTYFDGASISSARLNKLKWIETKTIDIGGGGILVETPMGLPDDYFMILHLGLQGIELPQLLVGRIRHSRQQGENGFYAGVEFVVKETCRDILPQSLIRNLPPKLFEFNHQKRDDLSIFLVGKYRNNKLQE